MLEKYKIHNYFQDGLDIFIQQDPHLKTLSTRPYQYHFDWWQSLSFQPGIYMLTGGRQVGKSTSCKQLIRHCLEKKYFLPNNIFYLPCDEIYDGRELSQILQLFLDQTNHQTFLLIIDEITFVKYWDRTIKARADEGFFRQGMCLLTGSDSFMLKEAAMSFPGRRGKAEKVDFHLLPLSFDEYVTLRNTDDIESEPQILMQYFQDYLQCGGYLPAINDLAEYRQIRPETFMTYEQWIRGDFLKQRKSEDILLQVLLAVLTIGVSQISYTKLAQKVGIITKDTCIDYCRLLERMDVLFSLQAFDPNKQQGAPRKEQKFHFHDPFICRAVAHWLKNSGYVGTMILEENLVESCVASHCRRLWKSFYFKGQGEIDVIYLKDNQPHAIEVKWASQIRPNDLKSLLHFNHKLLLTKQSYPGKVLQVETVPVYQYLNNLLKSTRND